jgi:magnesium transporter
MTERSAPDLSRALTTADKTVTWLDISNLRSPEKIRRMGAANNLHPMALEDVLNSGQRPKIDELDGYTFIILNVPRLEQGVLSVEQVSLFASDGKVISLCQGNGRLFDTVRDNLRHNAARLRRGDADYLLYTLIDTAVDAAFPVLEATSEHIDSLEEDILLRPEQAQLHTLHNLKRELLLLRKALWPQREVLNHLLRDENGWMTPQHRIYFRDCYDHVIQIIDLIETYREMLNGLLDLYLSSVNNRMNEVMRVLTIIATIFIPLTFLVGIYGMNFKNMPELQWPYGYPLLWGFMIALVLGMLWLFRRKHWL